MISLRKDKEYILIKVNTTTKPQSISNPRFNTTKKKRDHSLRDEIVGWYLFQKTVYIKWSGKGFVDIHPPNSTAVLGLSVMLWG